MKERQTDRDQLNIDCNAVYTQFEMQETEIGKMSGYYTEKTRVGVGGVAVILQQHYASNAA